MTKAITDDRRAEPTVPHVVVVGAGFAGLEAVRRLRRAPVRITLIDRRNHHLFQPLLYQVATAALSAPDIAAPIRNLLRRQRNVTVMLGEVTGVDLQARHVRLGGRAANTTLDYDFLVLATGSTHAYFGNDGWAPHAPGLKDVEDALEIRARVLSAYESAEHEPDPARRADLLTFVIVGAGPTGVELAGALAEIARYTLARDFRNFDPRSARVVLVDGAERVLPSFHPELSADAEARLGRMGVQVRTGSLVTEVDAAGVQIGAERIAARTVLWAAGVTASPLARRSGALVDSAGRARVAGDLSLPGHPEVFVAGDLARVEQDGRQVPGMAPAAQQMGRHAAMMIQRSLRGEPTTTYRYHNKGEMAAIGRAAAVADLGKTRFTGLFAWLLWLLVHIYWLVGFRNRLAVMVDWCWAYLTRDRGSRVIINDVARRPGSAEKTRRGRFSDAA